MRGQCSLPSFRTHAPLRTRGLLCIIVSFIIRYRIFCLLECASVDLVLGLYAVRLKMAIDWSMPGYVSWFPYHWETGEVLPLEKHAHVVLEHGRSTKHEYPIVPVMTCEPLVTLGAVHQALRVFRGESEAKTIKSSGLASSPVAGSDAYGTDGTYDGDLDDGNWYLNDVESTPGGVNTASARGVLVSFRKEQVSWRAAGLLVSNIILDLLTELAKVSVAAAAFSTLVGSPGASVWSYQSELLWANLSTMQCVL